MNLLGRQFFVCLAVCALSIAAYSQQFRPRKPKPASKQPAIELPGPWESVSGPGISTQAADLKAWWKNMSDRQLDTLIEQALVANLDLKIADSRVLEARALQGVANAARYPEINTNDLVARRRNVIQTPTGISAVEGTVFQVGFDASWELDFFGGIRNSVKAAAAEVTAAEASDRDVMVTLIAEVARTYVELRGYQRQLAVTQANIATQRDTRNLTAVRANAGLATDLDVSRVEAQLARTESVVPELQASIANSIHRLAVLLGKAPGGSRETLPPSLLAELRAPEPIPPIPSEIPIGFPSELLRRRPDIRRAEAEILTETARLGVARSELYPKFVLSGLVGRYGSGSAGLSLGVGNFFSLGPSVNWPIFSAGRIRSNIRAQHERVNQALLAYEKSVNVAVQEVEDSLTSYGGECEQLAHLEKAVASSRRAVELSRELYTAGLADFLSVLEAQNALYDNEKEQAQSETEVVLSLIALYKALGGGW